MPITPHPRHRLRRFSSALLAALMTLGTFTQAAAAAPRGALPPDAEAARQAPAPAAVTGTYRFPGNDGAAHKVSWDGYSLKVDGARLNVFSAEIHYWRLPSPELWRDLLQKVRAGGFNAVSLYFFWGIHSVAPGKYDFSGIRDIDRLLTIAEQEGLYVIARPGPYINAEASMGGLPAYMTNNPDGLRSTQPQNLAAAKEWLHTFDQIARKHQVTDGGGAILLYQVENELISETAARASYEKALVEQVRSDGITVPLSHNDYSLNKRWVPKAAGGTGAGADTGLDLYTYDTYPLGFNCNAGRGGISDLESAFRSSITGNPIMIAEGQGGAFTPWGASFTPAKCRQFVDPAFTRQWGVNSIGSGVTLFNHYMEYGGTNWGWTGSPSSGFTSYDYGAAIDENRRLTAKFTTQKQLAYQLDTLTGIASMQRVVPPAVTVAPGGADVLALSRQATENQATGSVTGNGSRYIAFRLADSNATTDTSFTFPLTLGRSQPMGLFTTDDADTGKVEYTGSWTHATGHSWTANDYKGTESFSDTPGDSVSYTFTGTAIQVVMPQSENHGYGDVYIDDVKAGRTNSYHPLTGQTKQWVAFEKNGLNDGRHTIKIVVSGQKDQGSSGTYVSVDAFNVPPEGTGVTFARIPQDTGTALRLHGRDALGVAADLKLGAQEIYYTTSEVVGFTPIKDSDLLLLDGYAGDPGETVLHYATRPKVTVTGTAVTTAWDAATSSLRLDYTHGGASQVVVKAGGRPTLTIRVLSRDDMATAWRVSGASPDAAGNLTTVVLGADLVRAVRYADGTVHLTGSMQSAGTLTVFPPPGYPKITFNGVPLGKTNGAPSLTAPVPGPRPVTAPTLSWSRMPENPETSADTATAGPGWRTLDKKTTHNPRQGPGNQGIVLDAHAYGAFEGHVWYRAAYTAATDLTSISLRGNGSTGSPSGGAYGDRLKAVGGTAADMLVWVNGTYAGARPANGEDQTLTLPAGLVKAGMPVVVSTLVLNLGQNLDWSDDGSSRANRGLHSAALGNSGPVTWRLRGALGFGEAPAPPDTARGLYNNGGLYGERAGWHLPGHPDATWTPATDLHAPKAGVTWYRSSATLDVPDGQDASFVLRVSSARFASKTDKSRVILFVNGWNTGVYAGNVGPQTEFTVPSGFLDMHGGNDFALAVVAEEDGAGPDDVQLKLVGNTTGGLPAVQDGAPVMPALGVTAAGAATASTGERYTITGTVTVPPLVGGVQAAARVAWGDGTTSTWPVADGRYTARHRYTAAGGDRATVTLVDAVSHAPLAEASPVEVTVSAGQAGASPALSVDHGTVEAGRSVTVTAAGFAAGETVTATLTSSTGDKVTLGALDVSDDGTAAGELTVPRYLAAGDYLLAVTDGLDTPTAPLKVAETAAHGNLALASNGAGVNASGSETTSWTPDKAIDGDRTTRWSSDYSDGAWITVKLARAAVIDHVNIFWEAACAAQYKLQVSADGTTWADATRAVSPACGGRDTQTVGADAAPGAAYRYVRVQTLKRTPIGGRYYGVSLWELEVWDGPEQILPAPLSVVPKPLTLTRQAGAEPFTLSPATAVVASGEATPVADFLAGLLRTPTGFPLPVRTSGSGSGDITITLDRAASYPAAGPAGTDEAYLLDVTDQGVRITAKSAHGAFNAVQTLRQLLPVWAEAPTKVVASWNVPAVHVADAPRFAYRGVMLDVARSFQTVDEVKQTIDTLAMLKTSALHIHLADDQGWRIQITDDGKDPGDPIDYAKLTGRSGITAMNQQGYRNEVGRTGFYTQAQFRDIVAYAKARFIQVVPEVDVPSHTNAALHAIPQLNTARSLPARDAATGVVAWNGSGSVGYSALDEQADVTYRFVQHVFAQLADMAGGDYVHIGGDESHAMGHTRYIDFVTKAVPKVRAATGKGTIGWSEYAEAGLSQGPGYWNGSVVQYWVGSGDQVRDFIAKGGKAIVSAAGGAYLDQKYNASTPIGLTWACSGSCDVDRYYSWEPTTTVSGGVPESGVLGVEASLWSETVRGGDQAQFLVFPRAASVLEIGWTDQQNKDVADFTGRLAVLGDRLALRGTNFYATSAVTWRHAVAATPLTARTGATADWPVATLVAPGTVSADGTAVRPDPLSASTVVTPLTGELRCPSGSAPVRWRTEQAEDELHSAGVYTAVADRAFDGAEKCVLVTSDGRSTRVDVGVAADAPLPAEPGFTPSDPASAALGDGGGPVRAGTWVHLTLTGFDDRDYVTLGLKSAGSTGSTALGTVRTSPTGTFDGYLPIPAATPEGSAVLTAGQGLRTATATVDVSSGVKPLPNLIDQKTVKVAGVDSQETAGENAPAANALDGNPATFWHTQWQAAQPGFPHWISLDLGRSHDVTGLSYLRRQDQDNGVLARYEVYVSADGVSWGDPVASGTFGAAFTPQNVTFPAVTARYVKLVGLSSLAGNGFGGAAEINIGGTPSP
ncbi:beta-galactosidase [Streptosporangium pseudovulgare]|uniref:beta-N-acetylhexosaminidase n=1 Tax=Streptosporangium pseudovulgare TaxID=35765 RepID=A0ABQ2QPK3_9ACTN|nr:beta-galactosidase [Streptosporangium pseudovulgare]GGP87742.1 hypothetical protein GCM10010140_16440 [Streptosporangium pseudovulgare]